MDEGAEAEVDRILDLIDSDGSGIIEYSEWVIGAINKKKILSDEKLE